MGLLLNKSFFLIEVMVVEIYDLKLYFLLRIINGIKLNGKDVKDFI